MSDPIDNAFEAFMKATGEPLLAQCVNADMLDYGGVRKLMDLAFHGGAVWGGKDTGERIVAAIGSTAP